MYLHLFSQKWGFLLGSPFFVSGNISALGLPVPHIADLPLDADWSKVFLSDVQVRILRIWFSITTIPENWTRILVRFSNPNYFGLILKPVKISSQVFLWSFCDLEGRALCPTLSCSKSTCSKFTAPWFFRGLKTIWSPIKLKLFGFDFCDFRTGNCFRSYQKPFCFCRKFRSQIWLRYHLLIYIEFDVDFS